MPPLPHDDNTPKVRTRQGCLTCRKRRRKCDEQKPRCQNCAGRSLDCRYGLKLTFMANKVSSLAPGDAQATQNITPSVYKQIKFVNALEEGNAVFGDEPNQDEAARSIDLSADSGIVTRDTDHHITRVIQGISASPQSEQRSQSAEPYGHSDNDRVAFEDQLIGINSYNDAEQLQETPAVSSSLAVYSHTSPPVTVQESGGPNYSRAILNPLSSQPTRPLMNSQFGIQQSHFRSPAREHGYLPPLLDNVKQNQLLKVYVDEVAPRLDVCTSQSSFGTRFPILAGEYTPLFLSILALASQHQCIFLPQENAEVTQSAEFARLAIESIGSDMYSSREEAVAACTLLMVNQLLSTQVQLWQQVIKARIYLLGQLGIDRLDNSHRGATSWMMLRLDLACSLLYETPPLTPLASTSPFEDLNQTASELDRSLEWTRRAMLLCSQVARFCYTSNMTNNTTAPTVQDTWTSLWSSSQSWLENLPSSMHPILQTPISAIQLTSPVSFPLIIHTNRSNMHAAVIYHITSVLLLQTKPSTERPSSKLKSPTWHAVQICGTCIGNNAHWSHDPTILAALVYAGRFISYWEQKKELLETLQALVVGSGWQFGSAIDDMVERWRIDSGQLDTDS